jgi:hypothetical protein
MGLPRLPARLTGGWPIFQAPPGGHIGLRLGVGSWRVHVTRGDQLARMG